MFNVLVEFLNMEIDNSVVCSSVVRKFVIFLVDSIDFRVLFNIMYLIVEIVYQECEGDKVEWRIMWQIFRVELGFLLYNSELFVIMLFGMVIKFCSGYVFYFFMKKVFLLFWKIVLCMLGGFEELQSMKVEKCSILGFFLFFEDSIKVICNMRVVFLLVFVLDLIEQQQKWGC